MATIFVNVNFYGHNHPELSGLPDGSAPDWKGGMLTKVELLRWRINVVGKDLPLNNPFPNKQVVRYNYNAVLGHNVKARSAALADQIVDEQVPFNNNLVFLVTAYSAGGPTALFFCQRLNDRHDVECYYIGLADPAFSRGLQDPRDNDLNLMVTPNVTARYRKNYFQTAGNGPNIEEVHDAVVGFQSFPLDSQLTSNDIGDRHMQACKIGNQRMTEDVNWCIANYPK